MGYLEFYEILTDDHIAPAFKRAVQLAKAGPRLLREAHKFEGEVGKGFNPACWTLTVGPCPQRDANWKSPPAAPVEEDGDEEAENGWSSGIGESYITGGKPPVQASSPGDAVALRGGRCAYPHSQCGGGLPSFPSKRTVVSAMAV